MARSGIADVTPHAATSVLLIDDDPPLLDTLRRLAELHVAEVRTATTGELGIAAFLEAEPALVICDHNLGAGMNGLEVLREMRQLSTSVQLVLWTGDAAALPPGRTPCADLVLLKGPAALRNIVAEFKTAANGFDTVPHRKGHGR